jgi:hypothetical protein
MKHRGWILLLLSGVLIILTPLAYASPPDPSWIRGVYDGDDFDDVVVLLTSGMGIVDPFPLESVQPERIAADRIPPSDERILPAAPFLSSPTRGPPSS